MKDIAFAPRPGDSGWYAQAMEKLIDVIQDLSLARDLAAIMSIVRTAARDLTGADGATFILRDHDKCYYADEDAISPLWKGQRFPMEHCISGWAMIHGEAVIIGDIYKDSRIPQDAYRPTFVKSLAMVPIRQAQPIGAIGNYWAKQRLATPEELKILQALANATSIAMENVALYSRLQEELQQVERTILDNIGEGIITINDKNIIIRYNKACESIFGYSQDDVIGRDIRLFLPPACLHMFDAAMAERQSGARGQPAHASTIEVEGQRKNGEKFPAELSVSDVPVGESRYYSAIIRDISERKQAERTLKLAQAEAERANRTKSEFLAHMSHELRTPLNSIIGLNRILYEDPALPGEHREMAGLSHKSGQTLLEIVNDILDLSKVESGKLELESIIFSFEEVVHNVTETLLPQCSEKNLVLTRDIDLEGIPYLIGDPLRIARVLINLIGNAIKYTEHGSITLQAGWERDGKGKAIIHASVTDTGIGIPEDKRHTIFDRFTQVDTSITRLYGGTGLGLAITREIIDKMGGVIGVESTVGKGSRFHFKVTLPTANERPAILRKSFKRDNYTPLPVEQLIPAQDLRLLIAEDHLLNQAFMKKLMPRLGITKFKIVDNGQAVIDALAEEQFDMALVDCHMPVLSGYEATRHIRKTEQSTPRHMPIIAMTADAMIGTRERCLKSGMDDYIAKPLNQDELCYIMEQWVCFAGKPETAEPAQSGESNDPNFSRFSRFSASRADIKKYYDLFVTQAQEDLRTLRDHCIDGDSEAWSRAAHRLKGGADMISAFSLKQILERAQDMRIATAQDRREILAVITARYEAAIQFLNKELLSYPEVPPG